MPQGNVTEMRAGALVRDCLILAIVTGFVFVLVETFVPAAARTEKYVHVVVDRGMSFAQIADRFQESGLIRNDLVFRALGRVFRIERRAKAGRYRFPPTANLVGILKALYRGATYREQIVVPPGRRLDQVAELMAKSAAVDSAEFVGLARDPAFAASLGVPSGSVEGFLYPETYDIEWREEAPSVLERMVNAFFEVFDDSLKARAGRLGMTVNEVVTLASIIEKEAYLEAEKPKISAVFHNRLRLNMKLQADPTVRYALGKWKGGLRYSDLKIESPFNTYLFHGLPPYPICSPGRSSLLAALYPRQEMRDVFFVAQGDGSHYFSKNGRDHEQAKTRYKAFLDSLKTAAMFDSVMKSGCADSLTARSVVDSLRALR